MADDPTTPDSALALDIKETLTGRAGPEVSAVTLGNVPPGAVLSAGADNGDGTWSLAVADLEGLTITPPPRWTGEINLVVSALTKSDDAATLPTTAFGISVMPAGAEVPPPPAPEPGIETPIIGLEIDTGLKDEEAAEDITVIISGVPAGAALSAGSDAGGGTWILTAADLSGLGLRPPADADGDFILGIAVTRTDEVVASGNLVVTVDGSLPATPDTPFEPEPEPASGPAPASETVPGAPGPAPAAYWKLDEMVPGRAADEIGGHHGLTHGVEDEDAPGPFDAVAVFDGVDDCIEIPHAEALAPAGGTLTLWFNAFATGGGTLAAKGAGGFALRLDNGRLTFGIPSPEGPREIDAGPFGANEWNQATVTWGPAGMKTYFNGQLIASDDHAGGLPGGPAPWFFGAAETVAPEGETRSLGDFFHGELDDIAIYAGQLSDAEVRDLGHFGIDGVMTGKTPAHMDSALDLGAIPTEADGPESLATVDADAGANAGAEALEAPEIEAPAAPDPVPEVPPGPVPDALRETPPEPPAEEEAGDVFVFGAGQGGDYAPGADGWSETAALEESPDDPDGEAITVAEGDELTIEGPEKLEW